MSPPFSGPTRTGAHPTRSPTGKPSSDIVDITDLLAALSKSTEMAPALGHEPRPDLDTAVAMISAEEAGDQAAITITALRRHRTSSRRSAFRRRQAAFDELEACFSAHFKPAAARRFAETVQATTSDPKRLQAFLDSVIRRPGEAGALRRHKLLGLPRSSKITAALTESLPDTVARFCAAWNANAPEAQADAATASIQHLTTALARLMAAWGPLLTPKMRLSALGRLYMVNSWTAAVESDLAAHPDAATKVAALESRALAGLEHVPVEARVAGMRIVAASIRMTDALDRQDAVSTSAAIASLVESAGLLYHRDPTTGELLVTETARALSEPQPPGRRKSQTHRALTAARAGLALHPAPSAPLTDDQPSVELAPGPE